MAKIKIDKDSILDRAQLYSKGGKQEREPVPFTRLNALSKDKSAKIEKIRECVTSNSSLFSAKMFEESVLATLTDKQLSAIASMVSKMQALSTSADNLKDSYLELAERKEQLANFYKQAIEDMSPYFEGVQMSQLFGTDSVANAWQSMDMAKPTKSDIELVEAFKMIGVELRLNHKNEWVYDENTKKTGSMEEKFRFSKDEVKNLVNGYLNKSISERGGRVITPEGLFRVYRERGLQIINGDSTLNDTEKKEIRTTLEEKCGKLFSKGEDWEINALLDQNMIIKNAQKIAFLEMSKDITAQYGSDGIPEFSDGLLGQIAENADYQASLTSGVRNIFAPNRDRNLTGRLSRSATAANDTIKDSTGFESLHDFIAEYDNKIKTLKDRQKTQLDNAASPEKLGETETKIKLLEEAKENLRANVEFIKSMASSQMGDNTRPTREDVLNGIEYSTNNYFVKSNGGDLVMVDRHSGEVKPKNEAESNALAEALKSRIMRKSSNNSTSNATVDADLKDKLQKLSNELGIYDYMLVNKDGANDFFDAMNDMAKLKIVEILFGKDQPFDKAWQTFKKKNPDKAIDDFITEIYPEIDNGEFFCNRATLVAGYEHAMLSRGEIPELSDKSKAHTNNTQEAFKKNIVLFHRVLNSLTPEEIEKFKDPTFPREAKYLLINDKINEAKKKPIDITAGNKEFNEAMAAHGKNSLLQMIKGHAKEFSEMEKEEGAGPELSNALMNYVDTMEGGKAQAQAQEQEQEESSATVKAPNMVKYGSLRPSTVDLVKYEKAMKGFSAKELKKRFFKPLLKYLKTEVYLNMDAVDAQTKKYNSANANFQDSNVSEESQQKEGEQTIEEGNQENLDTSSQGVKPETKQSTQKPNEIKQKDFESSVFIPGLCLVDKAMNEIQASEGAMSEKLGPLADLKNVLQVLSSVDEKGNVYTQDLPDGSDFRDACRQIAFEICKGNLKNGADVQTQLANTATKYSIPQDDKFLQTLSSGFKSLTPELMNYLFEFSSKITQKQTSDGKTIDVVSLGTKLPRELDRCTTDRERRETIEAYMNNNLVNYNEGSQIFNMLINDIYATKNGAESGFARSGDEMEFDGL